MSDKIYQDDMKDVAGGIGDKPICKCPNCSSTDFTTKLSHILPTAVS